MLILSFDSLYHPKSVCKQWKLHCEQNENITMRRIYRKFINISIKSQTWIVHPNRRNLNAFERNHGFKGPMNISDAINNEEVKDGDNILVHDGDYNINEMVEITKSINLYGLGKNVLITALCSVFSIYAKNVIIENVAFTNGNVGELCGYNLVRCKGRLPCTLRLNKCKFRDCAGVSARCQMRSRLIVEECSFNNASVAICVDSDGDCLITGCVFEDCGFAYAPDQVYEMDKHAILMTSCSKLECIRNTFENCRCLPIFVMWGGIRDIHTVNMNEYGNEYVVRDNVLKGNDEYKGLTFNANTVYSN